MIITSFVAAGALTGFFVGLTGVGGGALMTPILLLAFGIPPEKAIATDLWFAAITKLVGAKVHHSSAEVDWRIVKRLWMGSLPVALLTVVFMSFGSEFAKVDWLTKAIGAVVMLTGLGLWLSPWVFVSARARRIDKPFKFKALQPQMTILAGAILGLCVALTSVGAGALGSVMLLSLYPLRMTPHRLVATDLVHAIPLAVVAGSGYLFAGLVDWMMLLSLLIGSVPATILGSLLAKRMHARWVQCTLAAVLVSAGLKCWI